MRADSSKQYLHQLVDLANYNLVAIGAEKLTVDGTVKSLASIPATARYALMTIESSIATAAIRYYELGPITPPSATDGLPKSNLDSFDVLGYQNLVNFRVTQVGAGTHTLQVQYYR